MIMETICYHYNDGERDHRRWRARGSSARTKIAGTRVENRRRRDAQSADRAPRRAVHRRRASVRKFDAAGARGARLSGGHARQRVGERGARAGAYRRRGTSREDRAAHERGAGFARIRFGAQTRRSGRLDASPADV